MKKEIIHAYQSGKNLRQVGREFGVSHQYVAAVLGDAGVPTRSRQARQSRPSKGERLTDAVMLLHAGGKSASEIALLLSALLKSNVANHKGAGIDLVRQIIKQNDQSWKNPNALRDLEGKIYGAWIVGRYLGNGHWLCECSCGCERPVSGKNLRAGRSHSCGKGFGKVICSYRGDES